MTKNPRQIPPEKSDTQVVRLKAGYPKQDNPEETPIQFEERFTKFANDMINFEWSYRKSDDSLNNAVVTGLGSLKGPSALKVKPKDEQDVAANVKPFSVAEARSKTKKEER